MAFIPDDVTWRHKIKATEMKFYLQECIFLIKVVEGNKPCTAGLSQDTHIYNRSKAPITLKNTY